MAIRPWPYETLEYSSPLPAAVFLSRVGDRVRRRTILPQEDMRAYALEGRFRGSDFKLRIISNRLNWLNPVILGSVHESPGGSRLTATVSMNWPYAFLEILIFLTGIAGGLRQGIIWFVGVLALLSGWQLVDRRQIARDARVFISEIASLHEAPDSAGEITGISTGLLKRET